MSARPPHEARVTGLSNDSRRKHVVASAAIPTVAEGKRRLAAAGPDRGRTPETVKALGQAEEEAGGWLVGPAVYGPGETA
jgi:hypothetical protein